jgi:hypothetical protein
VATQITLVDIQNASFLEQLEHMEVAAYERDQELQFRDD